MNKIISLWIFMVSSLPLIGQNEKVRGYLSTTDTADLSILNIFPDSFPNVSVVFKAEKRNGDPVWNLKKEKMKVLENSQLGEVISLEQISKNKPIHLGIVFDHSGSMRDDFNQLFDKNGRPLFSFDIDGNPIFPKGYTSPIDHAKTAVKSFVKSFDAKKDFISIIGFSDVVDKKLPLTQDLEKINSMVNSFQADYSTALYDAMMAGMEELKKSEGLKVLVVLTDGQDNASKNSWKEVIKKANKEKLPIYIIGLGDVNQEILLKIANATQGQCYFTTSSSSLNAVYSTISKQLKAFYNLVYRSPNLLSSDTSRQIELSFDIDRVFLVTNEANYLLPSEVVTYLKEKEKQKEYLIWGGIGTAILISAGTMVYYFRRKKKITPTIKNLFPNPSNGIINLEFDQGDGELKIIHTNGQVVKSNPIHGSEIQVDINDLENGTYVAVLYSKGLQSNGMKFILQR